MKKTPCLLILALVVCLQAPAQADRRHIRQGNRLYRGGSYDKAETEYRKAGAANQGNARAMYNLGCALMQQQKDSAAVEQFEAAGKAETNRFRRSKSYHNIGVICQGHRMFQEAVDAYKESLRLNPGDDETRYNLALCQRQLRDQQKNQNQNQDKDKDKDKDQNKDKNKNKDQQQQQDKNKDQQQQQQQEQQQDRMSRENAEQLLQAAVRDEKDVQKRMQKQQAQPQNRRLQKNW